MPGDAQNPRCIAVDLAPQNESSLNVRIFGLGRREGTEAVYGRTEHYEAA